MCWVDGGSETEDSKTVASMEGAVPGTMLFPELLTVKLRFPSWPSAQAARHGLAACGTSLSCGLKQRGRSKLRTAVMGLHVNVGHYSVLVSTCTIFPC